MSIDIEFVTFDGTRKIRQCLDEIKFIKSSFEQYAYHYLNVL